MKRYQKSLSRRTLLRGAGKIAIGLPFLEEMRTRSVWGAPAAPPMRAFNIFLGGGVPFLHWRGGTTLDGPLTPLAPLATKMAFVRGIQSMGGHPAAAGAAFTGKNPINNTTMGGPSIDNEIMRYFYPSGKPPTPVDVQGAGYYYKFLDDPSRWVKSWDVQGHPSGNFVDDPKALFASFFGAAPGGAPTSMTPTSMTPTPDQKIATSILDTVVSQYQFYTSPASNLSAASQSKISDHLDAIRQLEAKLQGTSLIASGGGGGKLSTCGTPAAPAANVYVSKHHNGASTGGNVVAADFVSSFKVMSDVYAMGVACDLFRFGYTDACCAGDGLTFTGPYNVAGQTVDLGAVGETHDTNHAMGDNPSPGSPALVKQGYHSHLFLECCSYIIQQFDKYMDSNGQSILANSFVMLGTDLATNHSGNGVFTAISTAGGKFKPGVFDVTGQLIDFLTTCKAALGMTGNMPKTGMTSFLA